MQGSHEVQTEGCNKRVITFITDSANTPIIDMPHLHLVGQGVGILATLTAECLLRGWGFEFACSLHMHTADLTLCSKRTFNMKSLNSTLRLLVGLSVLHVACRA